MIAKADSKIEIATSFDHFKLFECCVFQLITH